MPIRRSNETSRPAADADGRHDGRATRPRAAEGDADDRLPRRRVAAVRQHPRAARFLPAGPGRSRVCRRPECQNLIPLAEGQYDRLPALAADLVHREVAVIVAQNNTAALAAQGATSTVPIVCTVGGDPIQMGLVASFNRPGGNITGVVIQTAELMGKRLEFLHELLPTATVVAVLVNPTNPSAMASETSNLQDAARALGLELRILQASTPNEIEAAFETLVGYRAAGLVVSADTFFTNRRSQIIALAADHAVPAIYVVRFFPAAGGLMSYGPDYADSYRQMGLYTGKILNGASPAICRSSRW